MLKNHVFTADVSQNPKVCRRKNNVLIDLYDIFGFIFDPFFASIPHLFLHSCWHHSSIDFLTYFGTPRSCSKLFSDFACFNDCLSSGLHSAEFCFSRIDQDGPRASNKSVLNVFVFSLEL